MGSPNMNGRYLRFQIAAATQRRPTFRAPNAGRRDGSLREPWGGPLSGPRAHRTRPDLNPDPQPDEPGGSDAA